MISGGIKIRLQAAAGMDDIKMAPVWPGEFDFEDIPWRTIIFQIGKDLRQISDLTTSNQQCDIDIERGPGFPVLDRGNGSRNHVGIDARALKGRDEEIDEIRFGHGSVRGLFPPQFAGCPTPYDDDRCGP